MVWRLWALTHSQADGGLHASSSGVMATPQKPGNSPADFRKKASEGCWWGRGAAPVSDHRVTAIGNPDREGLVRLQCRGLSIRGLLFFGEMRRQIFKSARPSCLSATVTSAADRELVDRFRALARASGLSVQGLLLVAVRSFPDGSDN